MSYLSLQIASVITQLTLVVAVLYFLLGLDDLVLDIAFWIRNIQRSQKSAKFPRLTLERLKYKPEQRIALFVPCWQESEVVDRMVEYAAQTIEYENYDIFVGVYPNDLATVEKVEALARRFQHVKMAMNTQPGPTTKGQNLNAMLEAMRSVEGEHPYEIMALHDVEDIIHPLELLVYNYLVPLKEMVQLPVFPLERPVSKWTAWTYADEFAEHHLKDLVFREAMGSFVPSAGVGTAFSRAAIEIVAITEPEVFASNALTEDYQVGLLLKERGFSTVLVHQRIEPSVSLRPDSSGASYVATRAYFPDTLKTAVRQKARWVAGICFQGWRNIGWVGNFPTRVGLYRDRKSVASNIISLFGFMVIAAVLAMYLWRAFDPSVSVPQLGQGRWAWALLDFIAVLTVIRLLQKAYFVTIIYGPVQGLLSMLRPPWGSLINGLATIRAIYLMIEAIFSRREVVWAKTEHLFPTEAALGEFRRQLGQVLVQSHKITTEQLEHALAAKQHSEERLGETLVRLGLVSEREVVEAMGEQSGERTALNDDLVAEPDILALMDKDYAFANVMLPLRKVDGTVVVAAANMPSKKDRVELREMLGPYTVQLAERERICQALDRSYGFTDERRKPIGRYLVDKGLIDQATLDQVLLMQEGSEKPLLGLLVETGMLDADAIYNVLQDYFDVAVHEIPANRDLSNDVLGLVPANVLAENEITFYEEQDVVKVVSAYPLKPDFIAELSAAFGRPVESVIGRHDAILKGRRQLLERFADTKA